MTTAMNPGLGGGPLLDTHGRVLGVVSLNLNEIGRFSLVDPRRLLPRRARRPSSPARGTGRGARAWLGVFCYAMNDHVVIAGMLPGGPGEQRAGSSAGDVVLAVDGQDVPTARRSIAPGTHRPGEPVVARASIAASEQRSR